MTPALNFYNKKKQMVRQFFQVLILLAGTMLLAFVFFYFWAQQEVKKEKLQVIQHPINFTEKDDSIIEIMTYNVGYLSGMNNNLALKSPEELYTQNLEKLIKQISKLPVNIIAFQEIDYGSHRSFQIDQHDAIASQFFPYSLKAINWDKRFVPFPYWPPSVHFGKMLSGQSTMSSWEISKPERVVLKKVATNPFYYNAFYLDRLAVSVLVHHPQLDFWVINVHTEAFDQATRKQQIRTIHEIYKQKNKDYPVILMGDFNSSPDFDEAAINILLNDSTLGCAAFNQTNKNYGNTFSSEKPVERLDYIFYSKIDFIEVESRILNEFGEISDHLPVYAKLSLCSKK